MTAVVAAARVIARSHGLLTARVFASRAYMSHDLVAPIPGAPTLEDATDAQAALQRLDAAAQAFMAWQGPLAAHFAYGPLDKPAYERAHAMHLADHLRAFTPAP